MKHCWVFYLISAVLISHCFAGVANMTAAVEKTRNKRAVISTASAVIGVALSAYGHFRGEPSRGSGSAGGCMWYEAQGCVTEGQGKCPPNSGFAFFNPYEFVKKGEGEAVLEPVPSPEDTRTNEKCSRRGENCERLFGACNPTASFISLFYEVCPQKCKGPFTYSSQLPFCCRAKSGNNVWNGVWETQKVGTIFRCQAVKCPKGRSTCSECGLQLRCTFKTRDAAAPKTVAYEIVPNQFPGGRGECSALKTATSGSGPGGWQADAQFGQIGKINWHEGLNGKMFDRWWKVE
jgi:hypothetical protein